MKISTVIVGQDIRCTGVVFGLDARLREALADDDTMAHC